MSGVHVRALLDLEERVVSKTLFGWESFWESWFSLSEGSSSSSDDQTFPFLLDPFFDPVFAPAFVLGLCCFIWDGLIWIGSFSPVRIISSSSTISFDWPCYPKFSSWKNANVDCVGWSKKWITGLVIKLCIFSCFSWHGEEIISNFKIFELIFEQMSIFDNFLHRSLWWRHDWYC